jgi:DeoR/GlpR family transcriptional regulator of sugar metabolism
MLKARRIEAINAELKEKGIVSIDELSEKLNISRSTIRRDIFELERQQSLKRVRGGAVFSKANTSYEPPFNVRQDMFLDEKQRIAIAAHELVQENETLLLGGGTTVYELSKLLHDVTPLYIATNDLMTAMELSRFSNVDLMVLGGKLRQHHYSLNGYFTENIISQIHADKAFISVDAVDFNIGFMNFSTEEIQTNKLMIKAALEVIVLCDHSKFEKIAFVNTCSFKDVDLLITGKEVDKEVINRLEEMDINIPMV